MKIIKTALNHIRRSPYQSFLIIIVLAFSFYLISSFATLAFISQKILGFFEAKPQIIAYLKDAATMEQVEQLKTTLEESGQTEKIVYVSKGEALKIYQENNQDNPLLLEMVTADILPASIEISANKIEYLKPISEILQQEEIISVSEGNKKEIDFQEGIVESLRHWTLMVRRVGLGVGGFLLMEVFLLIVVVMSMKITLKKEEVEILRLLGAKAWFIQAPFLLESAIYGFWGAVVGFGGMYLTLTQSQPLIVSLLGEIGIFPISSRFLLFLLASVVAFSSLLCALGSLVATRRYLK